MNEKFKKPFYALFVFLLILCTLYAHYKTLYQDHWFYKTYEYEYFYNILLSIVAGYIFYIFTVEIPEYQKRKKYYKLIKVYLSVIFTAHYIIAVEFAKVFEKLDATKNISLKMKDETGHTLEETIISFCDNIILNINNIYENKYFLDDDFNLIIYKIKRRTDSFINQIKGSEVISDRLMDCYSKQNSNLEELLDYCKTQKIFDKEFFDDLKNYKIKDIITSMHKWTDF